MRSLKSNDLVNYWLNKNNDELSNHFNANVLIFRSPLKWGVDSIVRNYIEEIQEAKKGKERLVVLLETPGGYIEIVERIYSVFRKYYPNDIHFIIPNFAYSAGTVLVLSGDEIYMDYYSILGPIDPQFESDDGQSLPGIGYLHKFNELVEKINKNSDKAKAELAYLIKRFDPAKLFHIEQARDHSITLLKEWLPKHKFKNWEQTETRKIKVTARYKAKRADKIAQILGEPKRWHSHGRGIGIRELQSEEIKLKIHNFGEIDALNKIIVPYYNLFIDYCDRIGVVNALHGEAGFRGIP